MSRLRYSVLSELCPDGLLAAGLYAASLPSWPPRSLIYGCVDALPPGALPRRGAAYSTVRSKPRRNTDTPMRDSNMLSTLIAIGHYRLGRTIGETATVPLGPACRASGARGMVMTSSCRLLTQLTMAHMLRSRRG